MFEFWLSSLHTYFLFDVSNASYYVEVDKKDGYRQQNVRQR